MRVKIGQPFKIEERNPKGAKSDEECLYNAMRKIAEMLEPEYQGVYELTNSMSLEMEIYTSNTRCYNLRQWTQIRRRNTPNGCNHADRNKLKDNQ